MLMEKFDLLVDTRASKTFLVLRIVFYVGSVILVMVGIAYFQNKIIEIVGKDFPFAQPEKAIEYFVYAVSCFLLSFFLRPLEVITHAWELYIANMKEEYNIISKKKIE